VVLTGLSTTATLSAASLIVTGVEQWALIAHDNFDDAKSLNGWNIQETSTCAPLSTNVFLGGHCVVSS